MWSDIFLKTYKSNSRACSPRESTAEDEYVILSLRRQQVSWEATNLKVTIVESIVVSMIEIIYTILVL